MFASQYYSNYTGVIRLVEITCTIHLVDPISSLILVFDVDRGDGILGGGRGVSFRGLVPIGVDFRGRSH